MTDFSGTEKNEVFFRHFLRKKIVWLKKKYSGTFGGKMNKNNLKRWKYKIFRPRRTIDNSRPHLSLVISIRKSKVLVFNKCIKVLFLTFVVFSSESFLVKYCFSNRYRFCKVWFWYVFLYCSWKDFSLRIWFFCRLF